jgi:hypothetical protein
MLMRAAAAARMQTGVKQIQKKMKGLANVAE